MKLPPLAFNDLRKSTFDIDLTLFALREEVQCDHNNFNLQYNDEKNWFFLAKSPKKIDFLFRAFRNPL